MSIKTKTKIHLYGAIIVCTFAALSFSSYSEIYQLNNNKNMMLHGLPSPAAQDEPQLGKLPVTGNQQSTS